MTQSGGENFRPGPTGACEATLFEFRSGSEADNIASELGAAAQHRIAASSLLEAVQYMAKCEPDFPIRTVRSLGLIVLLSGSSYR